MYTVPLILDSILTLCECFPCLEESGVGEVENAFLFVYEHMLLCECMFGYGQHNISWWWIARVVFGVALAGIGHEFKQTLPQIQMPHTQPRENGLA